MKSEQYKPNPNKSVSCTICGADTEFDFHGVFACFDCICDMQDGSSDRVKESIKEWRGNPRDHNIAEILSKVSFYTGISVEQIREKNRKREIVEPRQLSHYLAKQNDCGSLAFIGKEIGGKDHATVIHSIRTVSNLIETDGIFLKKYGELIEFYA